MSAVTKIISIIICFVIPCHALDAKQHYYFDRVEQKYHHLSSTLNPEKKQFLNEKIEAEIALFKKLAATNNLVLFFMSALSTICGANAIQTHFRLTDGAEKHNLHIGIMLTGTTAVVAIRTYISKNDIDKKIAKLLFKKSLLGI